MIKRLLGWTVAAVVIASTATLALANDVTLRVTLPVPLQSHLGENLELFQSEVKRLSGGQINVEIYESTALDMDVAAQEAVSTGQVDMGVISLTSYGGQIPAVDVFSMPFVFKTETRVRASVARGSTVRQPLDEAIEATGVKVLWWQAFGTVILLSNDGPILTPNDMKGKTVRVISETLGEWVETAGGIPELIQGSEQYLAYENGTVDIGMTGVSSVQSRALWDVMDTITAVNVADIEFVVVINQGTWDSLTEEQQGWVMQAARRAESDVRNGSSHIAGQAYIQAKANGMRVYTLSRDDLAKWRATAQPVIDSWLASSGPLARQVYDAAQRFQ